MTDPPVPNARDCPHGHLARSCELCELQARLALAERVVEAARAYLAEKGDGGAGTGGVLKAALAAFDAG